MVSVPGAHNNLYLLTWEEECHLLRVFIPLSFSHLLWFWLLPIWYLSSSVVKNWKVKTSSALLLHWKSEGFKVMPELLFSWAGQRAVCCWFWCRECREKKGNTYALLLLVVNFLLLAVKAWMFAQKSSLFLWRSWLTLRPFSLLLKHPSLEYNFIPYPFLSCLLFVLDDSAKVNLPTSIRIRWGEL